MNLCESRKLHKSFREEFSDDYTLRRLKRTADLLIVKNGLVFDAGCGNGLIQKFLPETLEYIGLDFNKDNLTLLWEGTANEARIVGNVTRLPFRDRSFDRVLSFEVIEHIPETLQATYIRELYLVLKNKGKLVLSTPNIGTYFHSYILSPPYSPKHFHCLTFTELRNLLFQGGFKDVKRHGHDIVMAYPHKVFKYIPLKLRSLLASRILGLEKLLVVEATK